MFSSEQNLDWLYHKPYRLHGRTYVTGYPGSRRFAGEETLLGIHRRRDADPTRETWLNALPRYFAGTRSSSLKDDKPSGTPMFVHDLAVALQYLFSKDPYHTRDDVEMAPSIQYLENIGHTDSIPYRSSTHLPSTNPTGTQVLLKSSDSVRARSGNPFQDGLIGVEPNPGPTLPKKKGKGKPRSQQGIGGKNATKAPNAGTQRTVALAAAYGTRTRPFGVSFSGMGKVLGSPAHILRGRCAVQNFAANATPAAVFQDALGYQANYMYLNPRICCQNIAYQTPAGNCPIGVMAQPWRKYSFRRVVLHYQPCAASTANQSYLAVCYDPEVITTSPMVTGTLMSVANFEAAAYGPIWAPLSLDITPYLDLSRWFYSETPTTLSTSLLSTQNIQGTFILNASTQQANIIYGMFFLEFELALSEMGPTEAYSAPAVSESSSSSSSSSSARPTSAASQQLGLTSSPPVLSNGESKEEFVLVAKSQIRL